MNSYTWEPPSAEMLRENDEKKKMLAEKIEPFFDDMNECLKKLAVSNCRVRLSFENTGIELSKESVFMDSVLGCKVYYSLSNPAVFNYDSISGLADELIHSKSLGSVPIQEYTNVILFRTNLSKEIERKLVSMVGKKGISGLRLLNPRVDVNDISPVDSKLTVDVELAIEFQ